MISILLTKFSLRSGQIDRTSGDAASSAAVRCQPSELAAIGVQGRPRANGRRVSRSARRGRCFLHRGNKIAEAKVICSTVPEIAGNRDICRIGGVRVYIQHSAHIPPGREGLFNMIKGFPDDFCSRMGLWSPMATTCCSTAGLAASGCRRVGSWFPHVRRQVAESAGETARTTTKSSPRHIAPPNEMMLKET